MIKLMSWNVNGLRARGQAGFVEVCETIDADIICLQETKLLAHEMQNYLPHYYCYLNPAKRRGYSGTALYTKTAPLRIAFGFPTLGNEEGRIIVAEYEKFVLVNVYTPNSQQDLRRLDMREKWDAEFARVCASVNETKPVIITGDLNVSHKEIDVHNPGNKHQMAGFTDIERHGMDNLLHLGFRDSFRHVHGDVPRKYSYWSYFGDARANNHGWRLDYFLVSGKIEECITDATIERFSGNSDHCPVTLCMEFD